VFSSGFHIQEGLLSNEECDKLLSHLNSFANSRAGIRNLMSSDAVNGIAHDSRLKDLAYSLIGSKVIPFKATLFNKTSKANWLVPWHQDTALPIETFVSMTGWSASSIKAGRLFAQAPANALERVIALRIHLDGSTRTNGPLRVIPKSHTLGVLKDDEIAESVQRDEAIECLVGRGGVVAMSPLILHASSKIASDEPRRVLHIEYATSLDTVDGMRLKLS
jgi:ectoine hydroxylase-related dioxygenase (phytanoyl-CoA dioxygenase family)